MSFPLAVAENCAAAGNLTTISVIRNSRRRFAIEISGCSLAKSCMLTKKSSSLWRSSRSAISTHFIIPRTSRWGQWKHTTSVWNSFVPPLRQCGKHERSATFCRRIDDRHARFLAVARRNVRDRVHTDVASTRTPELFSSGLRGKVVEQVNGEAWRWQRTFVPTYVRKCQRKE